MTTDDPVSTPAARHTTRRGWRLAAALALALAAGLLGGCGGGGNTAGVGSGGTGAFTVGTISGLGSIVVNGVRYEDNGARAVDDDGVTTVIGSTDNPLRLGMVVELNGRIDDNGSTGSASRIAYGAELKGPVTAVDATAGSFTVFGTRVRTTASTVYEDFGGVAALAVGNVVEVYGQADADGQLRATRVEREALSVAAHVAAGGVYRVRGTVEGLSGSAPPQHFVVGTVAVATSLATRIDGTLANGAYVALRLDPTLQPGGHYLAQRVQVKRRSYDDDASGAKGEVEGYVSGYTGPAEEFQVAGYRVRLASSVRYEDGTAADLADGVRIEAEGRIEAGVLRADKVEFKSRGDDDDDDDGAEFEFDGTASCSVCGAATGTFTIKGVTVRYDATTRFDDGLSGPTLDGRRVEVKGVAETTGTGTVYRATRIERED